ncbi:MAG: hypothetical protein LBQ35_07000 [Spirochaetaceae bacterium]|nr:hypothetical protein [Spirochaetaceae bacterium]
MKKIVALFLCLLVLGTAAFGLDKAAGGGVMAWLAGNTEMEGTLSAFGAFGFFGLGQYVELNAGVASIEELFAVGFGAYGKYPISLSDRIVIFPTAGADAEIYFADDESVTQLWLRGGAGLDFFFTDTMFLRSHLVFGVLIPISAEIIGTTYGALVKVGVGWMF